MNACGKRTALFAIVRKFRGLLATVFGVVVLIFTQRMKVRS